MSQETVAEIVNNKGQVPLVGSGPILVPACSIRVLEGSVKPAEGFPHNTLIERVEANLQQLSLLITKGECPSYWLILVAKMFTYNPGPRLLLNQIFI